MLVYDFASFGAAPEFLGSVRPERARGPHVELLVVLAVCVLGGNEKLQIARDGFCRNGWDCCRTSKWHVKTQPRNVT
jgi:hypothetical protein